MQARCQLCGTVIHGGVFNIEDETGQLMAYDSLSAHMWLHVSDHHRLQMEEGMMAQRRAAKMYAMNWADHTDEMIAVKQAWRKHMLLAMTVTTRHEDQVPQAQPASDAAADGSNEKKSARNTSN
jgi:hypothetical protein